MIGVDVSKCRYRIISKSTFNYRSGGNMRKVTYGGACSLDGFITGPDGAVDWLVMSPDVHAIMADFWKRTDTLLMGRKTWDVAKQYAGQPMPGMEHVKSYVFSRS